MRTTDTDVPRFLGEFDDSLGEGRVPIRAFNDPRIHELELDRVFTRAWVFVGHESEIPARGDYAQRRIGRDPFVLVHGEDGEIRVLFDTCRHRGAMVCRAERGNAALFRCPYHGWTYKNTGALVGAPFLKDAYGSDLDKSEFGLFAAPHVESRHGFVFASLDPEAPTFEEYLGDMKWHFDLMWGQCEQGWEVIGTPQRTVVRADWKTAAENFSGDDYHTMYLHRSTIETGIMEGPEGGDVSEWLDGYHVQLGNGHHFVHVIAPPGVEAPGFFGYPDAVAKLFSPEACGDELYKVAKRTLGFVGVIFPNFGFLSFPFRICRDIDEPVATMTIRTFEPRGPGEMVIWAWALCPKGASPEFRRASYRTTMGTFSAGGTFEQDDSDPWISIARSAGTTYGRKLGMKLNYRMGLKGAGSSHRVDDYAGPGVAHYPMLEEGAQRGFHRRWLQFMRSEGYPPAMSPEEQNAGAGVGGKNGDG
jgi:PAH dioxygenase large subunit